MKNKTRNICITKPKALVYKKARNYLFFYLVQQCIQKKTLTHIFICFGVEHFWQFENIHFV